MKWFYMDNTKTINISMSTFNKLDMDNKRKSYRDMIGNLLYFITSRSDIIFFYGGLYKISIEL